MKIGIVTVDDALAQFLETEIGNKGHHPVRSSNLRQLVRTGPALVFAEWVAGEGLANLLEGLRAAVNSKPPVPVVALVPAGSPVLMRRARSAGAVDVLVAPPDPEEIEAEIQQAADPHAFFDPIERERFERIVQEHLVGESPGFLRALNEMRLAAQSDANVLLIGETGTGKENFAQAIHSLSQRFGSPYAPVNCSAIPATLLESELFGAAKGTFTGADKDRVGRFEAAGAGTLLLDEVEDIEVGLQTKLLRVIEQRVFQRLGEGQDRTFWVRLICATAVNLDEAVAEGRFRQDFLGRINQFQIVLPPLRERRSDIPLLARFFLWKHAGGRGAEFSRSAMEALENFDFPMNVRQLENAVVEGLARSQPGDVILPRHLPKEIVTPAPPKSLKPQFAIFIPKDLDYKAARLAAQREIDRIYLKPLSDKHQGKAGRIASEIGIDRETLTNRLKDMVND